MGRPVKIRRACYFGTTDRITLYFRRPVKFADNTTTTEWRARVFPPNDVPSDTEATATKVRYSDLDRHGFSYLEYFVTD